MTRYQKVGNKIRVTFEDTRTGYGTFDLEIAVEKVCSGEVESSEVDSVLANVGYRPDKSLTQELQVPKINVLSSLYRVFTFHCPDPLLLRQ